MERKYADKYYFQKKYLKIKRGAGNINKIILLCENVNSRYFLKITRQEIQANGIF